MIAKLSGFLQERLRRVKNAIEKENKGKQIRERAKKIAVIKANKDEIDRILNGEIGNIKEFKDKIEAILVTKDITFLTKYLLIKGSSIEDDMERQIFIIGEINGLSDEQKSKMFSELNLLDRTKSINPIDSNSITQTYWHMKTACYKKRP